jgi:hypothetical protein
MKYKNGMRAAILSLAALGTAVLLAACGTSGGGGAQKLDKLGENEGALNLLIWPGYA